MIADAVIPGDEDKVEIKMSSTDATVERPFLVAVEMVKDKRSTFVDKQHEYAMLKRDQERTVAEGERPPDAADVISDEDQKADTGIHSGKKLGNALTGNFNAPEEASVGDIVEVEGSTYRVGHGNILVQGIVGTPDGETIEPMHFWRYDESAGAWAATDLKKERIRNQQKEEGFHDPAAYQTADPYVEKPIEFKDVKAGVSNRNKAKVEREPVGSIEDLGLGVYKVSGGYLEKIGLPDYSSLQIGPTSVTRMAVDDGRRGEFTMGDGRKVMLPLAPIEAQQECFDISEISMRASRQSAINFLESVKPGSTIGGAS
jgi:hypothetical protein